MHFNIPEELSVQYDMHFNITEEVSVWHEF
jgi:hypothetical protein